MPERSFIRSTAEEKKEEVFDMTKQLGKLIVNGTISPKQAMSLLGEMYKGFIQVKITTLDSPPNSPETIKRKGTSNPLIQTELMRKTVAWKLI